jgi:uncharacterized OB-fold protein
VILVSGNGGILAHHGTLIVSPHRPERAGAAALVSSRRLDAAQAGPAEPVTAGAAVYGDPRRVPAWPSVAGPEQVGIVRPDVRSEPFFTAADQDVLLVRRCDGCGAWLAPTASGCPGCADDTELSWAPASGRGSLVSWSVVHPRGGGPVSVPALVELAEGPWLSTGLRLVDEEQLGMLHAGQPVVAQFVHPADGASYPEFRPLVRSARGQEKRSR